MTETLEEVPKGAEIDYVDCGTPVCALVWEFLQPAAQTMGVKLERVKAGSAANTVTAAFDTVIAKEPAAVARQLHCADQRVGEPFSKEIE